MSAQCQSENEAAAGQGTGRAGRSPGGRAVLLRPPSRGITVFLNLHSTHLMRRLFMKHPPPTRQGSEVGKAWSLPCVAQSLPRRADITQAVQAGQV